MNNIYDSTVKNNLCTSCGICSAVCPTKCISFIRSNGQYLPKVHEDKCINCKLCLKVCSGHKSNFDKYISINKQKKSDDVFVGDYIACYNSYTNNEKILQNSTSGGLITTIVKESLSRGEYDCAFLVEDFNYSNFVETKHFDKDSELSKTSKSRYIPVSQKQMVEYVLNNKDKKVIVVGTSCAIHTFLNVVDVYKINRNNYLLLGLFCDKNLNYNIYNYFEDLYSKNGKIDELYFRTKEKNGWPGNVKLKFEDGKSKFVDANERMKVKDYFQLERCMYCIDKLNQFADISFGDNYTKENSDSKGTSTVVIRTAKGENIFKSVNNKLISFEIDIDKVRMSQHIDQRKMNLKFSKLLKAKNNIDLYPELMQDLSFDDSTIRIYNEKIYKLQLGRDYPQSKNTIIKQTKKSYVRVVLNKIKMKTKRIIKSE